MRAVWQSRLSLLATGALVVLAISTPAVFTPSASAAARTSVSAAVTTPQLTPASQSVSWTSGTASSSTPLTAGGFTGTVHFSISPDLPITLGLNPDTGVVSGTPAAAQPAIEYTITGSDGTDSATATVTIDVTKALPKIRLAPLSQTASGTAGQAIGDTKPLTPFGFTGTVTYTVDPALPSKLGLNNDTGVVSGTPTRAQTATDYTITGSDGTATATATVTIEIAKPKTSISPQIQPVIGVAGKAINDTSPLTASGFADTVTYSTDPILPEGLNIDGVTGVISGTPLWAQQEISYQVTATDKVDTASTSVSITIAPVLAASESAVNTLVGAEIIPVELTATGFRDPITFSVDPSGSPLPAGFSLDKTSGVLTGTSSAAQPTTTSVLVASVGTLTAKTSIAFTVGCADANAQAPDCVVPQAPAAMLLGGPVALGGFNPHLVGNSVTTDRCAYCHRTHSADQAGFLGAQPLSSTALCITCHGGMGAATPVYTRSVTNTYNDQSGAQVRLIFKHDPTNVGTDEPFHTSEDGASLPSDMFAVGNTPTARSSCVDCHDPHNPTSTDSARTPTGLSNPWSASGRINGASGVEVVNSADPSAISYKLVGGSLGKITREYELCMKCHSGYTNINLKDSFGNVYTKESQKWFDKAVEFNPLDTTNVSFHPVEGPGRNKTAKMTASLTTSATSGLRKFTFGGTTATSETIRCTNCHAGTQGATQGSVAANHDADFRGILALNYRDRLLRRSSDGSPTSATVLTDFALCFSCHNDAPFRTETSTATNFSYHGLHVALIGGSGNNLTDIDQAPAVATGSGDGGGSALCSECHFRLHSTKNTATDASANARLVEFSPNIGTVAGHKQWEPIYTNGVLTGATCYVVCHGKSHYEAGDPTKYRYTYTP